MRYLSLLLIAALAANCGFVVHLVSAKWLNAWIAAQRQGHQIQPSWDLRYAALASGLEYGLPTVALYWLMRNRLGLAARVALLAVLLTALHGALLRQPLMDWLVGNPLAVVLVQNCLKWLVWWLMATVVVIGVEWLHQHGASLEPKPAQGG
ncbi:hypothetical protein PVT67_12985 [Gallaecimonas kandeliae]|uniref:hypothetical protein n=1 Tax=Gallaecimonas kandeliae TaxID=3029055 RepID=UPI00264A2245|nr:hypothetical protein [Gallaecimonas kandeliae]WKE64578.1 hypothetical protein PVT67_12985 [Gallaecimonas kandeliae]